LVTVNSTGQSLSGANQTYSFYRLFGDVNGTGTVNIGDYNKLTATAIWAAPPRRLAGCRTMWR